MRRQRFPRRACNKRGRIKAAGEKGRREGGREGGRYRNEKARWEGDCEGIKEGSRQEPHRSHILGRRTPPPFLSW